MTKATALVQHGAADFRFEKFDLPTLAESELLTEVEANGLCGSDVDSYHTLDWY